MSLCESNKIVSKFEYTSKPEFETDFGFQKIIARILNVKVVNI